MSERAPGVFIVWDTEEVDVERRDAGTMTDRTVVVARRTVPVVARWTNDINADNIASANRYAESIKDQYDNVRVEVMSTER